MRPFTLLFLMVFVLLGAAACGPSGPKACTSDSDCGETAYCGSSGFCVQRASPGGSDGGGEPEDGGHIPEDDDGGWDAGDPDGGGEETGDAGEDGGHDGGDPDGGHDPEDGGMDAGSTCSPACESWEFCSGTTCSARYTTMKWTGPEAASLVPAQGVLLELDLVLADGTIERADPDGFRFEAIHISGHTLSGQLTRVTPGAYEGIFVPDRGGMWSIVASWPEAGLTSAPLDLEAECIPFCSGYQWCSAGTCAPLYAQMSWTSPASGAAVNAQGIPLVLELALSSGATQRNDPQMIAFVATHATAPMIQGQLALAGPGRYEGTFLPTHGGAWDVSAQWPSAGLSAGALSLMADCIPGCPSHEWCQAGACLPRYTGVAVTSPAQGRKLDGGTHLVAAELQLAPGASRNDPTELSLTVVQPDGGVGSGLLQRTDAGYYTGTWSAPPGDGTYVMGAQYPAAGLSSPPVTVTVDRQPPRFTITVPQRTREPADGGFIFHETTSGVTPWRRDETPIIQITSRDFDIVASSVTATLSFDGGTPVPLYVSTTPNCSDAFCGTTALPLEDPSFDTFEGKMSIEVRGSDDVGNVGVDGSATVPVTRFKWVYKNPGGAGNATDVVIGASGAVYYATSWALTRINPEGSVDWSRPGNIANIAVSPRPSGELICASERLTQGWTAWCAEGASGNTVFDRTFQSGTPYGRGALVRPPGSSSDCYVVSTLTGLVAICPSGNFVTPLPKDSFGDLGVVAHGDLVLVAGDSSSKIEGYRLSTSGWTPVYGYPKVLPAFASGLALVPSASRLLATSRGVHAFDMNSTGSVSSWSYPTADPGFNSRPVVGRGGQIVLQAGYEELQRVQMNGFHRDAVWTAPAQLRSSTVLGSRQGIHVTTWDNMTGGAFYWALDGQMVPRWSYPLGVGGAQAHVALDCTRDANGGAMVDLPGVAYVGTGGLLALVVDDRGLDPQGEWPRPGRDARGSNNGLGTAIGCP